jgi:hypothetical protein
VRHWRWKHGGERGDGGRLPRRGRHDPPRRRRPGGTSPSRFPSLHLRFGPFRFDLCRGGAGRPVYLAASRASPGELARPRLGLTGRAGVARGCLGLLRSRVGILLRGVGGGMWIRWIAVCDSPPSAGGVD